MNFFEHQDQARQNTLYLLMLFAIALLGMIGLFYLVATITLHQRLTWDVGTLFLVTFGVLLFVGTGSATKMLALRAGGRAVAESLGGHRIDVQTSNEAERQLLNVVEEMAIASGISVPAVYLLPQEQGINAFAAGFSTNDAVIGVTQGCLEQLNRDELQGVIAHEFSHILNGDMRLNLRLIGVLQGLLLIYLFGRIILRGSGYSRSNKGSGQVAMIGFAMIVIGLLGLLCGRLIKAAVSRQREFLADASAVQFTRNPYGIAGALRKIGGLSDGSHIQTPKAEEASHLFFGEALKLGFFGEAFATHPALRTRIRRLEGLAGKVSSFSAPETAAMAAGNLSAATEGLAMGFQGGAVASRAQQPMPVTPEGVVASIGTSTPKHLVYAQALLAKLPETVRNAAHRREGALAIVYGLLLDPQDQGVCDRQTVFLRQTELPDVVDLALRLKPELHSLDPRFRLPLIDLAIPALRETSAEQCSRFLKQVQALVQMDQRVTLAEYSLQVVLHRRLKPFFSKNQEPAPEIATIGPLWNDCLTILSALARVGHTAPNDIEYAFRSGLSRLPGISSQEMPSGPVKADLQAISQSLKKLGQAAPKLKQSIIDACAYTVLVDNKVTIQEGELLRTLVIALDCPIPPFLDATPWQKG